MSTAYVQDLVSSISTHLAGVGVTTSSVVWAGPVVMEVVSLGVSPGSVALSASVDPTVIGVENGVPSSEMVAPLGGVLLGGVSLGGVPLGGVSLRGVPLGDGPTVDVSSCTSARTFIQTCTHTQHHNRLSHSHHY